MSKDLLTTIMGGVTSSAVFGLGWQKFQGEGPSFEAVWLMVGGVASALWAYWTNKH